MTMLPSACAHEAAVEAPRARGTPDAAVHAHPRKLRRLPRNVRDRSA